MKVALIAFQFYPNYGGISHTLTNLCKFFKEKNYDLSVFNSNYQGKNIYKILEKSPSKIIDILSIFFNKSLLHWTILSTMKIIKDSSLKLSDRMKILLYILLKPKISINVFRNIYRIVPIFKKLNFDLVFGGGTGANALLLIFFLSRLFNLKVISLSHGNDFLVESIYSLKSTLIKNLDKIILSNKKMLTLIRKIHNVDGEKLTIINRAINLKECVVKKSKQELRSYFEIPEEEFILLSVGRQVKRKKFDLVINALYEIIKKKPSIKLKYYLIGSGPCNSELKQIMRKLNLENHVKFLGDCDNKTKNMFYKLSDLYLMPSIAEKNSIEGFGITFLEANYFKVPVIGAYSGGITEAIIDEKTGLLVKPNDVEDLVEKILYLYDNENVRLRMGKIGHQRILNNFNWDNIFYDYIRIFEKILED